MRLLVNGGAATVRRLALQYPDLLGHLLCPACWNRIPETGLPWGVDNRAFVGFDPAAFRKLLRRVAGRGACWIACPDAVGDARRTALLFDQWREEVAAAGPVAFVLQDGQEERPLPDGAAAYFVGGTTRFKLSQAAADLVAEGKRRGLPVHVGRVNSFRRIEAAYRMGADSVDGSSMGKFSETKLPRFCRWLRRLELQPALF